MPIRLAKYQYSHLSRINKCLSSLSRVPSKILISARRRLIIPDANEIRSERNVSRHTISHGTAYEAFSHRTNDAKFPSSELLKFNAPIIGGELDRADSKKHGDVTDADFGFA